jgi:hypothetical protein
MEMLEEPESDGMVVSGETVGCLFRVLGLVLLGYQCE